MLANPKPGTQCLIWYRASLRRIAPLHGKMGTVLALAYKELRPHRCRIVNGVLKTSKCNTWKSGPRNHFVQVDSVIYSIPCGQLNTVPER